MAGEAARELGSERRNDSRVEARYRDAPEDLVVEVLNGVLCMAPRPRPRHQLVAYELGLRLGTSFYRTPQGAGGWVFLPEPELALGAAPDRMEPDLAGWRRERLRELPESEITVAPDWVCEVLSPSTETIDRGTKLPLYGEHGVSFVWLVDPRERMLEAFLNDRGVLRPAGTFRNEARVRVPPFEAIELALEELWGG